MPGVLALPAVPAAPAVPAVLGLQAWAWGNTKTCASLRGSFGSRLGHGVRLRLQPSHIRGRYQVMSPKWSRHSTWGVKAQLISCDNGSKQKSGRHIEEAVFTVTKSTDSAGKAGWKAVMRFIHPKGQRGSQPRMAKRLFGACRPSICETVEHMLEKPAIINRIADGEKHRVLEAAKAEQVKRSEIYKMASTSSAGHSSAHVRDSAVHYVHQIYGLFGDKKPMSELFQRSQQKWMAVAKDMGAEYHLWNAAEVETLVKRRYPQFWEMYCDVRYPIMRADIGRICILHEYGGLYSDLDVWPNRAWYQQSDLTLPVVRDYKGGRYCPGHTYFEMEVIIGSKGNKVFLDWMEHIRQELTTKDWRTIKHWRLAKMRYIWNTTGPMSMKRFLDQPSSATMRSKIRYLECNHFKQAASMTDHQRRYYDVISHESNSYFTKAEEVRVPVGCGDETLPAVPTAKRMRSKCHTQTMGKKDLSSVPLMSGPDVHAVPSVPSVPDVPAVPSVPAVVEQSQLRVHPLTRDVPAAAKRDVPAAASSVASRDGGRVRELKAFLGKRHNSAAVKMLRQDMKLECPELEAWLTSDWPQAEKPPQPLLANRPMDNVWGKRGYSQHQVLSMQTP